MDKQSLGEMCPYSRLICFLVLTLSSEDLIFWEGPALGGDIASHHGLGTLWRRELGSKWAEPGWWWGDRIFPFTAPVSFFLPLNLCWRTRKERKKKKEFISPFSPFPLLKRPHKHHYWIICVTFCIDLRTLFFPYYFCLKYIQVFSDEPSLPRNFC